MQLQPSTATVSLPEHSEQALAHTGHLLAHQSQAHPQAASYLKRAQEYSLSI